MTHFAVWLYRNPFTQTVEVISVWGVFAEFVRWLLELRKKGSPWKKGKGS